MENGAFAPKEQMVSKWSIFHNIFKGVKRRYYGVKGKHIYATTTPSR